MNAQRRDHRSDRGASLAEYALLASLIAVVCMGALTFLGGRADATFDEAGGAVSNPAAAGPADESTGGESTGGDSTGGDSTGGDSTGGDSTGGDSTGGDSTGGHSTGGDSTGGDSTGGDSTGGDSTGGEVLGGESPTGSTWGSSSSTLQNKNKWRAEASVNVFGQDGKALTGVSAGVQIKVVQVYRDWQGNLGERSWTDQANLQNGVATFSSGNLNTGANGQEAVVAMRYEVTNVVYYYPQNPSVKWDRSTPSISVEVPSE
jgi:Flp pilus assembly pilin Flp